MRYLTHTPPTRTPWNKGKLIGQKPPLKLKEIWAIRIRLQLNHRLRDLALFNLAIDSKLRSCDLVKLRVSDVAHGNQVVKRAMVMLPAALRHILVTLPFDASHRMIPKTNGHSRYDLIMSLNTELIKQIARRHGATNIRIFGSYLHGTQKDDSDIDLLIDLEPGRGLFDLVAMKRDLNKEIGQHVDVVTAGALSPYMREEILSEAKPL